MILQKVRSPMRFRRKGDLLQHTDKAEHSFIQALTIHPEDRHIQAQPGWVVPHNPAR